MIFTISVKDLLAVFALTIDLEAISQMVKFNTNGMMDLLKKITKSVLKISIKVFLETLHFLFLM